MKKKLAELSKAEQAKIEAAYHNSNPQEFDDLMSHAKLYRPRAKSRSKSVRNPNRKTNTPVKQASK
jgi:hypothetical protein